MKILRLKEVKTAMEISEQTPPQQNEITPASPEAVSTEIAGATSTIEVPAKLIDQVIGQEHAVEVIKKAAIQRRHVMMIGSPGTGKSMLAKAMAELLPKEELIDIMVYPNSDDNNNPVIRTVAAGRGKQIVTAHKAEARKKIQFRNMLLLLAIIGIGGYAIITGQIIMGLIAVAFIFIAFRTSMPREETMVPKLLVSNDTKSIAPFIDATGTHAGALLGDVRHDPFQSGGLETPSHDRVEAGAIHRANGGVLFIDEINTLDPHSQQNLLTALQEGEFPITGQSERSSGAMVRTEPVPCKFVMVSAGNLDAIQSMHPALRSRIRGYGYEVYMAESMDDTPENREKYVRFIAQEVKNDGKIPHCDQSAIDEIIRESKRRSNRKGHLTLKLRDMGGLIRVAGDIARQEGATITTAVHVIMAKKTARSIEDQVSEEVTRHLREYEMTVVTGTRIGRVNGLAVMGSDAGSVLPIMAEVTHTQEEFGQIIATGISLRRQESWLKEEESIAQQSLKNVSALIKKFTGKDVRNMDIHIQFIGTYGAEGDSASITIATAVISAIEGIPVRQDVAMTGSLSVRGDVLPIGGVTYKIEAAVKAGIKTVLIPRMNLGDVLIEERYKPLVTIIPVDTIDDVLKVALVPENSAGFFIKLKNMALRSTAMIAEVTTVNNPVA